jgi:signal transduction histidine kinase/ligand-binding sensor domain-containing protein
MYFSNKSQTNYMKQVFLIFAFFTVFLFASGQNVPQPIQFERLTVADGLPENTVYSILQDHLGFMWFGTMSGLVQYDGTRMSTFKYDPDNANSIKGKIINTLYEDRHGDLWIGCENLVRFERATQRFIEYSRQSIWKSTDFDNIDYLHEDKYGDIWTITKSGLLDRFNPTTKTWTFFRSGSPSGNGLANDEIYSEYANIGNDYSFLEDPAGNIWVVTHGEEENTLHRFDRKASQFVRFKPASGQTIPGDFRYIGNIYMDHIGLIYASSRSGKGLFRINPGTGRVVQFKHDPENSNSLQSDRVLKVYQDSKELIWIPSNKGLDRFDPQNNVFTHFRSSPDNQNSPDPYLSFLHEMPDGSLLFASENDLNYYDGKSFIHYKIDDKEVISERIRFRSYKVDRTGLIWIGTSFHGLYKQSRLTEFSPHTLQSPGVGGAQNPEILTIYEAPSDTSVLWYGTLTGLDCYDKKTGTFTSFRYDSTNRHSIGKGEVTTIAEDKKRRFWIGVRGSGLYLMDREAGYFDRYNIKNVDPNFQQFKNVNDVMAASDGTLWIAAGKLAAHVDVDNNSYTNYYQTDSTYSPELFTFLEQVCKPEFRLVSILHPGNMVDKTIPFTLAEPAELLVVAQGELIPSYFYDHGWIEDSSGKIVWEMSYNQSEDDGYEERYRLQTQLIQLAAGNYNLKYKSDGVLSYGDFDIYNGDFWISIPPIHPEFWGIQLLSVNSSESRQFNDLLRKKYKRPGFSSQNVFSILEDSKRQFWMGTSNGLEVFNVDSGKFTSCFDYWQGPSRVTSILEDAKTGCIWVTDYLDGLIKLGYDGKIVKRYTASDGLPGNTLWGVQQDEKGFLWISARNGLCRFDPATGQTRTFGAQNGLPGSEYPYGPTFSTSDGRIYMAWGPQVVTISPGQVHDDPYPPEVVFTGLSVFGKPAEIGKDGPLKEHISVANKITLHHNQNDFTIQYTAVHFTRGGESQYAFRITPYDKQWIQAGTQRRARYADLPSGTYTFQVKAANADGLWNEKGAEITVVILPPWWKTVRAYVFYILLLVATVSAAFRFYRNYLIGKEKKRIQILELKNAREIEIAYTELKATQNRLIQSEKMASLGELTAGIAHEIQNPLNFINNFSALNIELMDEMKEVMTAGDSKEAITIAEDIRLNLGKISHHGKRADTIVKDMLQHSRSSSGVKEPADINALAEEYLRLSYHGLRAKDKSFNATMKSEFDPAVGKINIIPQDMGRAILNLINNAFYAVNEKRKLNIKGFEPLVSISTKKLGDKIEIRVSDNGTGIPQPNLDKIFQPFFTTKSAGQGTGLGLSLCYDIITKGHGGDINVESKEGEGSTFIVYLPL